MGARAKAIAPLAVVIGILAFLWTELSLNFTFHWVTVADGAGGALGIPENLQLILPTAFISWGLFFAAGGDEAAFGKVFLACVFGSVAALVTIPLAFTTADNPDFWGIALWVGVLAAVLVMVLVGGDWYYVAGTFPAFASVFLWWIATGLDGYIPNGGGTGNSAKALAGVAAGTPDPANLAGLGAGNGLLSTPWTWVWFGSFVTLVCGCVLGILSAKIAAAFTPRPKSVR
jgi:hypothetical protein